MSFTFETIKEFQKKFFSRHIGPDEKQIQSMLAFLEVTTLDNIADKAIPKSIQDFTQATIPTFESEEQALKQMKELAAQNEVRRSFIGTGYADTITPLVILRNVLENPGWYTAYTPYQAEIAQGRLEALLNFQTLTIDLTGLPVANASLLDEATAVAEAMTMSFSVAGHNKAKNKFFASNKLHAQNLDVLKTRAEPLGIEVVVGDLKTIKLNQDYFGLALQYPDTDGVIDSQQSLIQTAKANGILVTFACDPMALVLLKSPGELGADIAVGSFQRFGVPMGYGGPAAAFFATRDEFKRLIPGRIVGVSKDARGKNAIRLALQTREQHIRREKATSNICTAQVLLAVMSSMYAIYHGPKGLKSIALKIHGLTALLRNSLVSSGYKVNENFFDTLTIEGEAAKIKAALNALDTLKFNVRNNSATSVSLTLDEKSTSEEIENLAKCFSAKINSNAPEIDKIFLRTTAILSHPVFNTHHSEHEMLRYIASLERKDLSLNFSMIPLGSCTMKLNATVEMIPVTWPAFSDLHPFAPVDQAVGYQKMFKELECLLAGVTGFDAVSLQPNAGSQGEYAGLLVIRAYHKDCGQAARNVCLIPKSAHGTNPASAAMAGMKVVIVDCDRDGNVDVTDLAKKCEEHSKDLAALMVTYPSTHGVFETQIREICALVHKHGGQVYMDGANMNAQIGLCRPGEFGADVCHLNLHKTFCIPHGGGGPGMGPICVKKHLAQFLPGNVFVKTGGEKSIGAISAAPWGSASILAISYLYIKLMGADGLKRATQVAILNANYIAKKLNPHYPVLYKGENGWVAHECILDFRPLKSETGIEVEDVAKRLMDYGFHAPTISFPVPGTIMVEPTESESLTELDRFCDAMIEIRKEIEEVRTGEADAKNNILKNAPHSYEVLMGSEWNYPYPRERAAFPLHFVREKKFHVPISRIDNVYGDRNLMCSCPPVDDYR